MNLSDYLPQLLTMDLVTADIEFVQQLLSSILEPLYFQTVVQNIANTNISLAVCLALKQKIKLTYNRVIRDKPSRNQPNSDYIERVEIIAQSNPLWALFQKSSIMKKTENHKKYTQFISQDNQSYDFDFFELSQKKKKQSLFYFQENINWLFLMLISLKESYKLIYLTDDETRLKNGVCGLRDQLIAKLLIKCLIQYQNTNNIQLDILVIFKYIEKYLPQDDYIIGAKLTTIVKQIAEFINFQLEEIQRIKFWKKYGKDLSSFIVNLYYRFISLNSSCINENIIETLNLLLKYSYYYDIVFKNQDNEEISQQEIDIYEQPKEIHKHLYSLRLFIINLLKQGSNFKFQMKIQLKVTVNIIEILSLLAVNLLKNYEDPLISFKTKNNNMNNNNQSQLNSIFDILATLFERSLAKLQHQAFHQKKESLNDYYEYEMIKNIVKILSCHIKFALKQNRIINFICLKYFFIVVQNTKIRLMAGSANSITEIFIFYYKTHTHIKIQDKSLALIQSIEKIFLLFLQKLSQECFEEEFSNCEEEKQLTSSYFKGIILFIEEHQKNAYLHLQQSFFSLIYQRLQQTFIKSSATGRYLIRFSIYVAMFTKNPRYSFNRQNKFQLILYLIENLKDSLYKKQFLLLLDLVIDQLIDQDAMQFNQALSYFWYYLSIKKQYCLKEFSDNICQYLLSILFTSTESELFTYSIHILLKMCRKYQKVELNKVGHHKGIKSNVIKRFMPSIYKVFTNLEKSCINNVVQIEQRIDFLQLTRFMDISSPQQVYLIFQQLIYQNLKKQHFGNLYFLIDASILLKNIQNKICGQILFQLMVKALQQNESILNQFSPHILANDQEVFHVFYLFYKITLDYCKNKCERHSQFSVKLIILLYNKSVIFSQIYDTNNFEQLSELYVSLLDINMAYLFLPKLPKKIYNTASCFSARLVQKYLENLNRIQSSQQILILFQNIFQRRTLDWKQFQLPEMQEQILSWQSKPNAFLILVDYIERSKFNIFFDYTELSKQIILHLYNSFQEKRSESFSERQYSIDTRDDESQNQNMQNYIEQFFKSNRYCILIKQIVVAYHSFTFIQTEKIIEFTKFEEQFIKNAKDLLKLQRI